MALTAIPLVGLLLAIGLAVRAMTGGGPAESGAAVAESRAQARLAIENSLAEARTLLRESKPERAEAVLRERIDHHPMSEDLRLLLGETLLMLDRPLEAYEQYNEAVGAVKDNPEIHFAAGTVASVAGLVERAEEHYRMAQKLDTTSPKYPLYLAQIERKLGKLDEAKASLIRAVKLEPELAVAWGALADIAFQENKLSVARMHLTRALELAPDSHQWRLLQARILRRENQPEQAAIILDAILSEAEKPDPMALREQALCLGMLGRREDAAALYVRAVSVGHEDPAVLAELCYEAALWHERIGALGQAKLYAEQAAAMGEMRAEPVVARLVDDE